LSLSLRGELWTGFGLLVFAVAACVLLQLAAACRSRGVDPFGNRGPASSDWRARAAAMAVALLNLLFLPTAQLAFTALACTDSREPLRHLNLLPWVACDGSWRTQLLPPALLVSLFALVPFVPFALLLRGSVAGSGGFRDSLRAALASTSAGFRLPWWPGAQLLRRFLLAATIAFVPYHSAVSEHRSCPSTCLHNL
jgi:hypothetical protein